MKCKNMTRKALFTSIISLLLCVSMLVGTTFAWFTDEVETGMNTIAAGNLDVELEANGVEVKPDTMLFSEVEKWEPGVVVYENLQVVNKGTLALKYQMSLNFGDENYMKEGGYKLSEVLKVAVIDEITEGTSRETVLEKAKASANKGTLADFSMTGTLEAVEPNNVSTKQAVVIYWEPQSNEIDNRYNANNGKETSDNEPLHIEFGVKLEATQLMHEEDSFGNDYDEAAKFITPVSTLDEFFDAVEAGNNVLLKDTLAINASFIAYMQERYTGVDGNTAVINGKGITVFRTEEMRDKPMFAVDSGYGLTLSNITVDGGAVWSGEINPYLQRGTDNAGMTTSGALISVSGNGAVVLNEGAVLQNNDGANAVSLGTRTGSTLTLNGGEIINNHSAAGAIWGGGAITINSGKVNGNHGGIGGAIRVVTNVGTVLTMNGGEMNHNMSDDVGGAIWAGPSRSNNVYVLNGGEMAYNYSPVGGGAIYAGYYETVKIGGTFKLHDNSAPLAGAIRFHDHASFVMTGGEIYDNGENSLFLNNNSASITGGKIADNFAYSGGLGLTIGNAEIEGTIAYNLSTNHNTAYLASEFKAFKFTVNEADEHFANFNFKPAADYTYTEGDEAKLICMNEGYETYWDTATSTFRLKAQ